MANAQLGRIFRILLAVILLIVGLAGLFLPILQGVLFIAAGLLLLVEAIPKLAKYLAAVEQRYPRISQALTKLRGQDGSLMLVTDAQLAAAAGPANALLTASAMPPAAASENERMSFMAIPHSKRRRRISQGGDELKLKPPFSARPVVSEDRH